MNRRPYLAWAWRSPFVQIGFLLILSAPAIGKTIHVDDDAEPGGDGKSWTTAYRYLQDALAEAGTAEKPVEIRVGQGLYKPDQGVGQKPGDRTAAFQLIDDVSIKGGFAGLGRPDPNGRDVTLYETILSGDLAGNDVNIAGVKNPPVHKSRTDNTLHIVQITDANDAATLEGLIIANGNSNEVCAEPSQVSDAQDIIPWIPCPPAFGTGPAIWNAGGRLILVKCVFRQNSGAYGEAVSNRSSNHVNIESCIFQDNFGGAVGNTDSTVQITGCTFERNVGPAVSNVDCPEVSMDKCLMRDNSCTYHGAAIASSNTGLTCTGSAFIHNVAGYAGGAVAGSLGSALLKQCLFVRNSGCLGGGAVSFSDGLLNMVNCTLAENNVQTGEGGAVRTDCVYGCKDTIIENSIFWANTAPVGAEVASVGKGRCLIDFSLVQGLQEGVYDPCDVVVWGRGDLNCDPLFVDPQAGDFHLRSEAGHWDWQTQSWIKDDVTSPCIDAGDPNSPVGCEPLPNGGRINMGAYGGTPEASMSCTRQDAP